MNTCTCHSCLLENELEKANQVIADINKTAGSTITITDSETLEHHTFYTTTASAHWLKAKLEPAKP